MLQPVSTPFTHDFDPDWRTVSVAAADAGGLDCRSMARMASGRVMYAGGITFTRPVLADGSFSVVVPAGIYTPTPVSGCITCTPVPAGIVVDLATASQPGPNFSYP